MEIFKIQALLVLVQFADTSSADESIPPSDELQVWYSSTILASTFFILSIYLVLGLGSLGVNGTSNLGCFGLNRNSLGLDFFR